MKPLTMTNSPWAKFTTSVALKMRTNPSAIRAYTQPGRQPAHHLTRQDLGHRLLPSDVRYYRRPPSCSSHPLALLRPLAVLHDDETADAAHARGDCRRRSCT